MLREYLGLDILQSLAKDLHKRDADASQTRAKL